MHELKLVEIKEGEVRLRVPDLSFYSGSRLEPAWAPVFYNPHMSVSRDISVAMIAAYSRLVGRPRVSVCEPLSATGVRGLRYAVEVSAVDRVVINDASELAYKLELENVSLNGLLSKVEVYNREARALLLEFAEKKRKFDVVDIDPFGSPAPFIESAFLALKHKGLLCVTATDLAPLFGSSPSSCKRKYFANPLRTEFSRELGARILAGFVVREAAKLGLGARPLFTVLTRHSMRLAVLVERSKSKARKMVDDVGYVQYCVNCSYRTMKRGLDELDNECPRCSKRLRTGGPLWIGELWDRQFTKLVIECYEEMESLSVEGLKVLRIIAKEAGKPPLYTTVTVVSRFLVPGHEPSRDLVIKTLEEAGYEASPTHFDSKGLRASLQPFEIAQLLKTSLL